MINAVVKEKCMADLLVLSAALACVALGLWSKPPSCRRLLFQSVVKSTEAVKPASF